MSTTTPTPDLAAIKARQQATWSSGDYTRIGARIPVVSELLADRAGLEAGAEVLDVAAGSGNTTIAAARQGCRVTGLDYVPALLEAARQRIEAERLEVVDLVVGDAERLPFRDESFDAVISVFGVMFAPDQERAASELTRVCRPGGTIALAAWTPDGFIGQVFKVVASYLPPPPGLVSPMRWGTGEGVRELLGDRVDVTTRERTFRFRYREPREFVDTFGEYYGPTLKALEALEPKAARMMRQDLEDAAAECGFATRTGSIVIPATYLEVVGTRR